MKKPLLIILIIFLLISYSFSQKYLFVNNIGEITLEILNDNVQVTIKNNTDRSFFIPIKNNIKHLSSTKPKSININFGIDLEEFNERGVFELEELQPNNVKTYIVKCKNYIVPDKVYFSYQFYSKKIKPKKTKVFYNTDFVNERNWLKKGNWEWSEFVLE